MAGRRRQLLAVLLGAAALAAVVSWGAAPDGPAALMEDDGLDADSIGMDQNAMLANSPKKNAAFLRVFGSYLGRSSSTLKSAPKTATQLSQQGGGKGGGGSRKGENSKLASEMQAELTAGSADEQMMTPHFVAALNAASRPQMLASTDGEDSKASLVNKEAMAALSMTDKGKGQHVLPAKLREKYLFKKDRTELGATNTETPNQAALRAQPAPASAGSMQALAAAPAGQGAQGSQGAASAADSKLLASAPEGLSTKQLIRQAAMRQMAVLKAKASMVQAQQPAAAPVQQPAATQQMYQPTYGSPMYPAAQPQYAYAQPPPQQPALYQQAPQPMLSGYGAQAPAWYPASAGQQQPTEGMQVSPYNDTPQRLSGYQAPQSRTAAYASFSAPPPQQLAARAPVVTAASPVLTPEEVGEEAANKAAPDMFSPDATIKGKASASSKREQMLALKSQIMSDYKKNTEDADKQLLMGV
eukprot:CAMPEP_0173418386 /NCGR_PEP_ID=MMETSP1357-20121228/564_1 /TAXON_ID=77926 /ORGANISM="Hemiselmis rufescens, Strain PCC563" /LENGTH=470 /DNA_ID=CAMNT_0014380871 /DNA_START=8 /DNA_END=1420 /DNA_ORIENTATION=+